MKIKGIIWLDEILEKIIGKHDVQQREVREVLNSKSWFRFVEKGTVLGKMFMLQWVRLMAVDI